jgi:hypothetical protein
MMFYTTFFADTVPKLLVSKFATCNKLSISGYILFTLSLDVLFSPCLVMPRAFILDLNIGGYTDPDTDFNIFSHSTK